MNELWKTLRLASSVLILPLIATAAVSAFQWTNQQDQPIPATTVSNAVTNRVPTTRNHAVKLDRYGNLSGRIWAAHSKNQTKTGAAYLSIYLMQNGRIAASTKTGSSGEFSVNGIAPGIYSFIANGSRGISVHAIRVVDHDDASVAQSLPFETVAITQNTKHVQKILHSAIQSQPAQPNLVINSEGDFNLLAGNRVQLDEEGNLVGNLVASVQADKMGMNRVILLQDGDIIAETQSNEMGIFSFENIEPGHYDFVSTGPNGHAAFGFEALESQSVFRQTSYRENGGGIPQVLQTALASPQDISPLNQNPETFPVSQDDNAMTIPNQNGGQAFPDAGGGPQGFGFADGPQPGLWRPLALIPIIIAAGNNNGTPPGPNSPIN